MSKTNSERRPLAVDSTPGAEEDGSAALLGIAAVERDTGLSKDLLRVWERRYGFPQPLRDPLGERLYPPEQVQRLRLIKRLLDAGHRPSHVVALPAAALQGRLASLAEVQARTRALAPASATGEAELDELLAPLLNHQLYALQEGLQAQLLRRGLGAYLTEVLAPLVARVGHLWSLGQVQIYEEHLFTEVVQQQLHRAITLLPDNPRAHRPRVLLSTVPGEEHGLGLLMGQVMLRLAGCHCVSLGLQTPLSQLVEAARTQQADVLALSFSVYAPAALVEDALEHLARNLPATTEVWAGGGASVLRRLQSRWGNVRITSQLDELASVVQTWRSR